MTQDQAMRVIDGAADRIVHVLLDQLMVALAAQQPDPDGARARFAAGLRATLRAHSEAAAMLKSMGTDAHGDVQT